jgi:hypothetical protein
VSPGETDSSISLGLFADRSGWLVTARDIDQRWGDEAEADDALVDGSVRQDLGDRGDRRYRDELAGEYSGYCRWAAFCQPGEINSSQAANCELIGQPRGVDLGAHWALPAKIHRPSRTDLVPWVIWVQHVARRVAVRTQDRSRRQDSGGRPLAAAASAEGVKPQGPAYDSSLGDHVRGQAAHHERLARSANLDDIR